MRSVTDTFIKHPVLAAVVNLVIVLVGWRAITTLPVQQYPNIQSSSVLITTVYYGASAGTVRGFPTNPIDGSVPAIRRAGVFWFSFRWTVMGLTPPRLLDST